TARPRRPQGGYQRARGRALVRPGNVRAQQRCRRPPVTAPAPPAVAREADTCGAGDGAAGPQARAAAPGHLDPLSGHGRDGQPQPPARLVHRLHQERTAAVPQGSAPRARGSDAAPPAGVQACLGRSARKVLPPALELRVLGRRGQNTQDQHRKV
ncbi:hypothetical protein IWQ57_002162, partial [Coemansia nantahalensis]